MSDSSPMSMMLLCWGSACTATAVAVALVALQSDTVAGMIMNPDQINARRAAKFLYRWNQALARVVVRCYWASVGPNVTDDIRANENELLQTTFFDATEKMVAFSKELVVNGNSNQLRVLRIGADERIVNSKEHFVWLVNCTSRELYQLPLTRFCTILAEQFHQQVTSTTFCFVADASGQQGSRLVVDLIKAVDSNTSVLLLQQPVWMVCLAGIVEQRVYSNETLQRIVFALCRLEATLVANGISTVLVTLPGQSVVPQLMPLLQRTFPDHRHVFMYTGCIATVQSSLNTRRAETNASATFAPSWDETLKFTDSVVYTTPLALLKSTHVMEPFRKALASLPLEQADVVETWMTAVDTYFALKEQQQGYLPYVCKLDYLWGSLDQNDNTISNDTTTAALKIAAPGSPSYWALRSLLQYVTGSKSRPVSVEKMDAAVHWLRSYVLEERSRGPCVPKKQVQLVNKNPHALSIENAVFQHKLILIENKTLLDTVQPAEHWTLKAAVKRGCACCVVGEEEEEEEEEEAIERSATTRRQRTVANPYVDGSTTFAFDPAKFS
jgi:hypothetical protein